MKANWIQKIKNNKLRVGVQRTLTAFFILFFVLIFILFSVFSSVNVLPDITTSDNILVWVWVNNSFLSKQILATLLIVLIISYYFFGMREAYRIINPHSTSNIWSFKFILLIGIYLLFFLVPSSFLLNQVYYLKHKLNKNFFITFFLLMLFLATFKFLLLSLYIKKTAKSANRTEKAIFVTISLISFVFTTALYYVAIINSWAVLFLLFAIPSINDTFAYIIGSSFGKRKLFSKISPNKTLEGFVAGNLSSVFLSIGLLILIGWLGIPVVNYQVFNGFLLTLSFNQFFLGKSILWWVFAIVIIIFLNFLSSSGDLFFSQMKRYLKIKDYSNLLGKHGGIYDRFDSHIFVFGGFLVINIINNMAVVPG